MRIRHRVGVLAKVSIRCRVRILLLEFDLIFSVMVRFRFIIRINVRCA